MFMLITNQVGEIFSFTNIYADLPMNAPSYYLSQVLLKAPKTPCPNLVLLEGRVEAL